MTTKETILEILEDIKPGVPMEGRTELATGGVLESFDILTLISELNMEFGIMIPLEEVIPDNFDRVEDMAALVDRLKA